MRSISVGQHVVPVWLIATLLLSGVFGTALANYIWTSVIVDLEVKEPLKILHYPKKLRLYPGETKEFNITIKNSASRNYTIILDFSLENKTCQEDYVTFSNETYTVVPNEQNLTAWLRVEAHAPPIETPLTIDFSRIAYPSGLVAYWKFDEGSGPTAHDSSGNGHTGTLVNGPQWVDGKHGTALSFDGEDDYVDCGTLGDFGSTVLEGASTYMCWLNSSQTASSFILGTENDYPEMALVIHTNTPAVDKIRVYLRDDSWKRLAADLADPFDFTGTGWHHFAFVLDAEHAKLAFYIDAIPRAVEYYYEDSPSSFSDFQYPLYIGAHDMWGSIEYGPPMQPLPKVTFEGAIDEVMIFNRALTEEEIEGHYGEPAEVLFSDDFDNGVADGWTVQLGNFAVVDGEYYTENDVGEKSITAVDGLACTDCIIETNLRFGDTEVGFFSGIVFRYTDNEHHYCFAIGAEHDWAEFIMFTPEHSHYGVSLALTYDVVIDQNTDYLLRVCIHGNTFTGFLNGEEVLSAIEGTYTEGQVGLRGQRSDAFFDNFTVYSLP